MKNWGNGYRKATRKLLLASMSTLQLTFFLIFSFSQKQMRKAKFFSYRKSFFHFLKNTLRESRQMKTNRRLILTLLQFTYTAVPVSCSQHSFLLQSRLKHPSTSVK